MRHFGLICISDLWPIGMALAVMYTRRAIRRNSVCPPIPLGGRFLYGTVRNAGCCQSVEDEQPESAAGGGSSPTAADESHGEVLVAQAL